MIIILILAQHNETDGHTLTKEIDLINYGWAFTSYLAARDKFVQLWGNMASSWGINKTMSHHALLYAESEASYTDEIMSILDISRGNANMNLRRLLDWELIHKVQFEGDRKDYFSAETDVWKIVNTIISERQQREIAPIRNRIEECITLLVMIPAILN